MKKMLILFPLVLALIIVSTTCALAAGPPVSPGPPIQTLKGEWQTIGTRSCVQADVGSNLNFGDGPKFQLLVDGSSRVTQETGVLSLFGDGTGVWSGKAVQINYHVNTAGSYPVAGYTTECDNVTYQSWPDGTIKFKFDSCAGTFQYGYLEGGDSTQGKYHYTAEYARVSADGMTMMFWDLEPIKEEVWTTTGGVTTNYYRICSRTGTAIKFR